MEFSVVRGNQRVTVNRGLNRFYSGVLINERSPVLRHPCSPESLVGSCVGCVIVPAGEVKDFYRGYALVGISAAVIVTLAGIVLFFIGTLP